MPEYTDEELNKPLLYIQQIATSNKNGESYIENATKWLMDVLEVTLFVYFDQEYLCWLRLSNNSSHAYHLHHRAEQGHVFSVDGFHCEKYNNEWSSRFKSQQKKKVNFFFV